MGLLSWAVERVEMTCNGNVSTDQDCGALKLAMGSPPWALKQVEMTCEGQLCLQGCRILKLAMKGHTYLVCLSCSEPASAGKEQKLCTLHSKIQLRGTMHRNLVVSEYRACSWV